MIVYEYEFVCIVCFKLGMKVLDFGCGIGGFVCIIIKVIGCKIIGIINSIWYVE